MNTKCCTVNYYTLKCNQPSASCRLSVILTKASEKLKYLCYLKFGPDLLKKYSSIFLHYFWDLKKTNKKPPLHILQHTLVPFAFFLPMDLLSCWISVQKRMKTTEWAYIPRWGQGLVDYTYQHGLEKQAGQFHSSFLLLVKGELWMLTAHFYTQLSNQKAGPVKCRPRWDLLLRNSFHFLLQGQNWLNMVNSFSHCLR